jgi:hypothetical protein
MLLVKMRTTYIHNGFARSSRIVVGCHTLVNTMPSMMVRRATWARRGRGAGWQGEAHRLVHVLVDEQPMVSTVGSMSRMGDAGDKWSSLNNPFITDATHLLPVKLHILAAIIQCDTLPPHRYDHYHPSEPTTYHHDSAGCHHHRDDGWQQRQ